MNVPRFLFRCVGHVTPAMHKIRRHCFFAVIESVLGGGSLSVTGMGRNIDGNALEKHRIKRVDRLCSNGRFHREIRSIYQSLVMVLAGRLPRPVILIDWSDLDDRKDHFLIRASLAAQGRSLTLYEEIHPLRTKEKPHIHRAFMETLKGLLPDTSKPIIVTDAGFRIPWFKLVISLDWDYVGRVRNRTHCQKAKRGQKAKKSLKGNAAASLPVASLPVASLPVASLPVDGPPFEDQWQPIKDLYEFATRRVKDLGKYYLGEKAQLVTRMVVLRRQPKGRIDKTVSGERARRSKASLSSASREKEPWLLATSLDKQDATAQKIAKIYATRMQIEESFRDLKSGLGLNASGTRSKVRLDVLMVIAAVSGYLLYWLGLAVKEAGRHYQYQSNSIKSRNILSCQFIGQRAYNDKNLKLMKSHWAAARITLQKLMENPNAAF